jgi:hypothetical protein
MRVTAQANHGHFLFDPQSAYGGLSWAIRVHGMKGGRLRPDLRTVGHRRGDKAPTNTRYTVHRSSPPNYMLPLHATGLNRSSSACRGGLCTSTCALMVRCGIVPS